MEILTHTGGVAWTNCFLVADEDAKEAALFDAPDHTVAPLLEEAGKRGWKVKGLLLTHGHFDHFADHAVVGRVFPQAGFYIHKLDEPKALRPDVQTGMFGVDLGIAPFKATAYVEPGVALRIGSIEVIPIYTPGHSPGHVCYHIPKEDVLIGGDLIIGGSVGRTDLPDSNLGDLQESIRKVMALPGHTRLLGGHGEATTLDHEKEFNPYVRAALG